MKTKMSLIFLTITFCLMTTSSCSAIFDSQADKAEEKISKALKLREIGIEDEAVKQLTTIKNELLIHLAKNSDDTKALFAYAKTNLYLKKEREAMMLFEKVFEKDPSKRRDVCEILFKMSDIEIKNQNVLQSLGLIIAGARLYPPSADKATKDLITIGNDYLTKDAYHMAEMYFGAAEKISPNVRKIVSKYVLKQAEKQKDPIAQLQYLKAILLRNNDEETLNAICKLFKNNLHMVKMHEEVKKFSKDIKEKILDFAFTGDYVKITDKYYKFETSGGKPTTKNFVRLEPLNKSFQILWDKEKYSNFFMLTKSGRIYTPEDIESGQLYLLEEFIIIPTNKNHLIVLFKTTK